MRIMVLGGGFSTPIGIIQHYVRFKYQRKRNLCDHWMLTVLLASFSASNMVAGQEIFHKTSKTTILREERCCYQTNLPLHCVHIWLLINQKILSLDMLRYVRQRMGRNKLKSFGPLVCRMAMLANIRSGSFFFKALGITLLFMAGFPDDLVRKETKYRNLDLLQKYYRYCNNCHEDNQKERLEM